MRRDHKEGRAMHKPKYPEWARREAMLWKIHEWVEDRPAGEEVIRVERLVPLLGGGEYVNPTDQDADEATVKLQDDLINRFIALVKEGLIDADIHSVERLPLVLATVRRLSDRVLEMIQELPDPNRALLDRLDDLTVAIRGLQDVPEEEKGTIERLAEELKELGRRSITPVVAEKLTSLIDSLLPLLR
jgi:hypothetical protein